MKKGRLAVRAVASGRPRKDLLSRITLRVGVPTLVALFAVWIFLGTSSGATYVNWSQYLFSAGHTSYNKAATAITPANASTIKQVWKFTPDTAAISGLGGFYASPTVYNGVIYIGARNGYFYAINDSTGAVVWKRLIGYVTGTTCGPQGFTATATVANDPTTSKPTVYVYGATGYLYAMDAATGNDVWPPAAVAIPSTTQNDYYAWGSALVAGGHVYVPISSQCDQPLVQGGAKMFDQATGNLQATYFATPSGSVGASIWSSPAANGTSSIYVTTGNGPNASSDAYSIVKLDGATLAKKDIWTVPVAERDADGDFGGSPTIWTAMINGVSTKMVGACNKNGKFYAFRVSSLAAGPVWTLQEGNPDSVGPGQCDAAAVFDGSNLFLASNGTTINGVAYDGAIREVDPATGQILWETGLTGSIIGTPTLNGSGVIAALSYGSTTDQNGVFFLDKTSGQLLKTIPYAAATSFGQPVFADGYVIVASRGSGLRAYAASAASGDTTPPSTPALTISTSDAYDSASGSTVFYNPSGTNSGGFNVAASTSDPESGIASVSFPVVFGSDSATDSSSPYSKSYVWSAGASATGAKTVTAKNGVGLTSTAKFTVTPDTSAPASSIQCNGAACAGTYSGPVTVTLSADDGAGSGVKSIFYTTDGSNPTTSSNVYSGPFMVSSTTAVKFRALDKVSNLEPVESTTITVQVGDFTIAVSPTSKDIGHGKSATFTVTVTAQNGFTGTVSLSISGLPSLTTATFTPTSITGSGTSQLVISVGNNEVHGTYPLSIHGTSGSLTHNASLTIRVT